MHFNGEIEFEICNRTPKVEWIFSIKWYAIWRVASYICLFRYIVCVATLGLSYTGTKETKHPKQMHPPFFTVFLTIRHAEQNLSLPCMHYRTLFSKVSFCINCWITFLFLHLHSQFGGMNLWFTVNVFEKLKDMSFREIRNLS